MPFNRKAGKKLPCNRKSGKNEKYNRKAGKSRLKGPNYGTNGTSLPLPHAPPLFLGENGVADFYAQNPIFGHIGVSKLIISGLLALPSYRVITHQNCSLSRPTPPSVLRFEQNPSGKVIFVNQSPPESYLVSKQKSQRTNNGTLKCSTFVPRNFL